MTPIESFAAVRAKLDAGISREQALAGEAPDFSLREEKLLVELADAAERGEMALLREYTAAYDVAMSALIGPMPNAETEEAPVPRLDDYAHRTPASAPRPVPVASMETEETDPAEIRRALPFNAAPIAAPLPRSTAKPHEAAGTEEIDPAEVRAALLPFVGAGAVASTINTAPPPAPPPPPPVGPGASALPRTVFLPDSPVEQRRGAETLYLRDPAAAAPAVPFAKSEAPPVRSIARGTISLPSASRGFTKPASAAPGVPVGTPFASPNAPLMPLEEYAAIHAELTSDGDPQKTFERLAINPVSWMSAVRRYTARFAEEPATKSRFNELVEQALAKKLEPR